MTDKNEQVSAEAELAFFLAKQASDTVEEILNSSITSRLGKDWTIGQLKDRCTSIVREGNEVFYLDGIPILTIGSPEIAANDTRICINRTVNYWSK